MNHDLKTTSIKRENG